MKHGASIPHEMDTSPNKVFAKSEMYECSNQTSQILDVI